MAATIAGISTLGITFGYGMETAKGVKPTTFTKLDRINSIGGISIENETIDASAMEDFTSRYIQGRGDTGGSFPVSVNFTPETQEQMHQNAQHKGKSANDLHNRHKLLGHGIRSAQIHIAKIHEIAHQIAHMIQTDDTNKLAEALEILDELFHFHFLSLLTQAQIFLFIHLFHQRFATLPLQYCQA